jgi:hypothetical protein
MGLPMKNKPARVPVRPATTPAMQELYKLLLKSEKFLNWERPSEKPGKLTLEDIINSDVSKEVVEKHYSVSEISDLWGISVDLARDIFKKEPGVLALDRTGRGKYITMRVPESVMERVHRRLSQG